MKERLPTLFLVVMLGVPPTFAHTVTHHPKNMAETRKFHLDEAARYGRLANDMEKIIADHEKTKAGYEKEEQILQKSHLVGPNGTDSMESYVAVKRLSVMISHCEKILNDAEKLKKDYEDFAQWHKDEVEN